MPRRDYSRNKQGGKLASESYKAGTRTYFYDIREAKSGKPYLMVTESRYDKNSGQRERSRLILYPEDVQGFQTTLKDMIQNLMDVYENDEPAPRERVYSDKRRRYNRQQSFDDYDDE